jgi:hypothetical protein
VKDVYAFIVGIDRYAEGAGGWDIEGPAANACAIAARLLDAGVPAANIHLFLSCTAAPPPGLAALAARGVSPEGEAKWQELDDFWRDSLPLGDGSKLFVFWSGHGFSDDQRRRIFLCSDYTQTKRTRVFNADNFVLQMQGETGKRFTSQRIFADVCGTYSGNTPLSVNNEPIGPLRSAEATDQLLYYASPDGEYAVGAKGVGAFTSALLEGLGPLPAWPDQAGLIAAMTEAFKAADVPAMLVTHGGTHAKRITYPVGQQAAPGARGAAAEAVACLNGLQLTSHAIRRHFIATAGRAGRKELLASQGNYGMVQALAGLADGQAGQVSYYLCELMLRISRERSSDALTEWIETHVEGQRKSDVERQLGRERPVRRLVVEIPFDPDKIVSTYTISLRDQNLRVPPKAYQAAKAVGGWDKFAAAIAAEIEAIAAAEPGFQLELDFMVDLALFAYPFHQIPIGQDETLGTRFKCVLHFLRRRDWQERWDEYCEAVHNIPFDRLDSLCIAMDRALPAERGLCFAGFALAKDRACQEEQKKLKAAMRDGTPYLLWVHGDLADPEAELKAELAKLIAGAGAIERLPDQLARRRGREEDLAPFVSLLWDDPQFDPFQLAQGPTA